jgi:Protein of unknown function (DUF1616)
MAKRDLVRISTRATSDADLGSTRRKNKDSSGSISIQKPDEKKRKIEEIALEKEPIELSKLVDELQGELGYKRDRLIRRIMALKEAKRLRIVESKPYASLYSYFFSPLSLWFWGAAAATLASLVLTFFSSGPEIYLRYIFGGLLVLFLPGFSLVELLYAKKQELEDLTRMALSIGLSLAIVPLIGLVLNYTPFGIRLYPVAICLTLLTIIFLIAGVQRKHSYYKLANDIL